jgi:L-aminopeptidase/D-esterase-like protein
MTSGITDVAGIRVGHAHDLEAITGCTALLFEEGAKGGMYLAGMASGTRACDVFREEHLNEEVHGLLLSGGSNYGLDAAGGVMRYLEERGSGFHVGVTVVPIVPAAILFDLRIGDYKRRPDPEMGYQACLNATEGPVEEGSVGAGTGATVGKLCGLERAMKSGVGTASVEGPYGPVGALAAVNAFGDVVDPETGRILAGLRDESGDRLISTAARIKQGHTRYHFGTRETRTHTTLAVVATEVALSKAELSKLARLADLALAKTLSPCHASFDGDVIFAISTAKRRIDCDLNLLGVLAQEALTQAITRAVLQAKSLGGVPAYRDLFGS